jgi:uncharacterized membrane protein (DUF4010 family)
MASFRKTYLRLPLTHVNDIPQVSFPYPDIAFKVALASGIGLLVGLEREWAQKEIGVRTFAITGLLGMLTSLLLPSLAVAALVAILLLVTFLNIHSLLKDRSLELTTSICLVVIFFLGVLVGEGHYFTAATSAIAVMTLLAWKLELERFAGALRPEEIRSAVLLGLLSVVIYPLLPNHFVDPWQLLNPRQYWVTVVVIAGIGFLNYTLLRIYGARGMYYAALLGGLVNSTAAVAELAALLRTQLQIQSRAVTLLLLTNISMFVRNLLILIIFAPKAVISAIVPMTAMVLVDGLCAWLPKHVDAETTLPLNLSSPISLKRILKFGLLFLVLTCAGTLAQRFLGDLGFLAVAVLGGLASSASTTASAATLVAAGKIGPEIGGIATVLTSIASATVNLPLVFQQTRDITLTRRLAGRTAMVVSCGLILLFFVHL